MAAYLTRGAGFAIFCLASILNFFVFSGVSFRLGGDALNGKREGSHYYLFGHNAHTGTKGYTEVSAAVYRYSQVHAWSVIVSWVLMFAGAVAIQRREKREARSG